jgi:PhzF family phenazine biosynthesis protein
LLSVNCRPKTFLVITEGLTLFSLLGPLTVGAAAETKFSTKEFLRLRLWSPAGVCQNYCVLRRFEQVDVFSELPYRGNPLAVVVDGDGLSDGEMSRFANWTNLSETTFLLPPTDQRADYRVRIFTASYELPFAGHPTLGSCHAWLASGASPNSDEYVIQECGVGLVRIRRSTGRLAFAAPPLIRSGPIDEATTLAVLAQLNISPDQIIDAQWIDNGPGWLGVLLASADEVLSLRPASIGHHKVGVIGPYPAGSECAYEVRALFPSPDGVVIEDPVTGSLNASLAQWLLGSGRATSPYVASQGTRLGRAGRVFVDQEGDDIWIGGHTVTCIAGSVDL